MHPQVLALHCTRAPSAALLRLEAGFQGTGRTHAPPAAPYSALTRSSMPARSRLLASLVDVPTADEASLPRLVRSADFATALAPGP